MSDIELVIKIPEHIYEHIKEVYEHSHTVEATYSYIYNGIPLPKDHGDLKDAEKLKNAFILWSIAYREFTDADITSIIHNSPTIIKANVESNP